MILESIAERMGATIAHTRDEIDVEARRYTVGGSDIPAILGVSPFSTPVDLWVRKTTGAVLADNDAMKMGRLLEPVIRGLYAERFPHSTLCGKAYVIGREPWITANLDDFAFDQVPDPEDGIQNRRVVEFKKVSPYSSHLWGEDGSDDVPVHYRAQVEWYCGVMGVRDAHIAALIGDSFRVYPVNADPVVFGYMVERAREFMECVRNGTPPEPTNEADVAKLYPKSVARAVVADDEALQDVIRLRDLTAEAAAVTEAIEEVRGRIKRRMLDADALTLPNGDVLATWRTQKRESVDIGRLRKEAPDVAARFMKSAESRVFLLK